MISLAFSDQLYCLLDRHKLPFNPELVLRYLLLSLVQLGYFWSFVLFAPKV